MTEAYRSRHGKSPDGRANTVRQLLGNGAWAQNSPYVALALGWTRHVLGDAFHLLTPGNIAKAISTEYQSKDWRFSALEFDAAAVATSVVAKSDYIRMAYVLEHGGVWLDADTILLST